MKKFPAFDFYRTKYGAELLIDVVPLELAKVFLDEEKTHSLSYYDITLITAGEGLFSIDQNDIQVKPGSIVFTRPGDMRRWDTLSIKAGYALIFEEEFLLTFFNDPNFILSLSYFNPLRKSFSIFPDHYEPRVLALIQEIKSEIDHPAEKDFHMLRALLYEALMLLNRIYNSVNMRAVNPISVNNYVNRFITLVNENYRNNHDVKYYADKLCITANHLNHIIRNKTNINAKGYICNKLILEAKRLLTYSDIPVTELAERIGYESSSYFIRFFRNQTGMTPLQYRKKIKHSGPCR